MAEGRTSNSCWYFSTYGSCRQGDNCPYPHVSGPTNCKFFQQGRCKFGSNCRFRHVDGSHHSDDSDDSDSGSPSSSSSNGARLTQRQRRTLDPQPGPSHSNGPTSLLEGATCLFGFKPRKKANNSDDNVGGDSASLPKPANEWVHAPEFVPNLVPVNTMIERSPKSYAEALKPGAKSGCSSSIGEWEDNPAHSNNTLCPYAENGDCKLGETCTYLHGQVCELCDKACLHPTDQEQRKKHNSECVKQHEKDMELSFAVARSKDKMCGICFEVIMEKNHREQRFGILPNCNHCFCLSCIRTWRQAKQFENNITRACPECRVTSDFVCPSMYWVDTKEDKEKLITDYKGALSTKDCKYFKKGEGKCPFGNKCFYLHILPDGSRVDVGPPSRQRRRNADGDMDVLQHIILWDFLEERDAHILYLDELDLDDFSFTDSDFSDSDIEFMF